MEVLITNANVRTSDDAVPHADTLLVEDGRIRYVGDRAGAPLTDATVVDLGGRTVIPGLIDAHTHPAMVASSRWHIPLPVTLSRDELLAFIGAYADAHPREEAPYLYFEYYDAAIFGGDQPTRHLLDAVVSDRPVLCQNFTEHEHWVNTRMLELMGVTRETPDPVPGLEMFVRDDDGEPTGLLRELVHLNFIDTMYEALGWRPPEEPTPQRLAPFFRFMSDHGVTGLFDALVEDESVVASVAELDRHGELRLDYEGAVRFRRLTDLPEAIERLAAWDRRHGGPHVRLRTLKLFLDGTNESGNGAVLAPLDGVDASHPRGDLAMDAAELAACLRTAQRAGVGMHIHLVGDRAFRTACDAVEAARAQCTAARERWDMRVVLSHCELVDPADMRRPADLGITVNWTPHWSGGYFGEGARPRLGVERWERMYRFGEIADHGADVTFGSDVVTEYEAHRAAPFFGMQVAATRIDPEYPLDAERYPDSVRPAADAALPVPLLLQGYTIAAARQLRLDARVGSLAVGKAANLCVLDRDPLRIPVGDLARVGIDAVLFEGHVVAGSLGADVTTSSAERKSA